MKWMKEWEKRELFLRVEYQLINAKGMMEIENHYLTNTVVIIVASKKVLWEAGFLHSLKESPHKILFHCKGKKSNFTLEKYHLINNDWG